MTTAGTVGAIWRYPVKSMRGETLSETYVSALGLQGDRIMALIDRTTRKVASAKYPRLWGRLLECQAAFESAPNQNRTAQIRVTLPDGTKLVTGQDDVTHALSDMLGRDVTLTDAAPPGAETEREYPVVDGLPVSGTSFSAEIGLGAPPGSFFDYAPIHLVTSGTLALLHVLSPEAEFDLRRFRPNLVIATPAGNDEFVENDWVGRTLVIGDLRLRVTDPTPRCVVTTLAQPGFNRDLGILRTIAQHNRPPIPTLGGVNWPSVGVYAVVERDGTVHTGDTVRLEDPEALPARS